MAAVEMLRMGSCIVSRITTFNQLILALKPRLRLLSVARLDRASIPQLFPTIPHYSPIIPHYSLLFPIIPYYSPLFYVIPHLTKHAQRFPTVAL